MYISTPPSTEVENFQMKIYDLAGDQTPDPLNQRQICYHLSHHGELICFSAYSAGRHCASVISHSNVSLALFIICPHSLWMPYHPCCLLVQSHTLILVTSCDQQTYSITFTSNSYLSLFGSLKDFWDEIAFLNFFIICHYLWMLTSETWNFLSATQLFKVTLYSILFECWFHKFN